jgi:hypothetical protein
MEEYRKEEEENVNKEEEEEEEEENANNEEEEEVGCSMDRESSTAETCLRVRASDTSMEPEPKVVNITNNGDDSTSEIDDSVNSNYSEVTLSAAGHS